MTSVLHNKEVSLHSHYIHKNYCDTNFKRLTQYGIIIQYSHDYTISTKKRGYRNYKGPSKVGTDDNKTNLTFHQQFVNALEKKCFGSTCL